MLKKEMGMNTTVLGVFLEELPSLHVPVALVGRAWVGIWPSLGFNFFPPPIW